MYNRKSQYSSLPVRIAWLICFFIMTCISSRAMVQVHVQYLTTVDGLANNSVRYIFQDSKGFIWLSTLNGLCRYDGNSFRTFLPHNDGRISLADRRIQHIYEDGHGFLWIQTSVNRFSCYDLKSDRFVDFTGCGAFADMYSEITIMPDAVWLWGKGQGCRRVEYVNEVFTSHEFDTQNGSLKSDNVNFVGQGVDGRVWIGTGRGLFCWNGDKLTCMESEHDFLRMRTVAGLDCFISADGCIWMFDSDKLTSIASLSGLMAEAVISGELVVGSRWIIFTREGGHVFDVEKKGLCPVPEEWNIPGGMVSEDNRGDYWVYNKTGCLRYVQVATGKMKVFSLMPPESVRYLDMERYHVVHDSRDILWITTYGNGLFTYDLVTDKLTHYKAGDSRSPLIASNTLQYIMEDRSGSIWVSSEYTGVSHLKVVSEGALQFYPEPMGADETDMYRNNVRMLKVTPDGDIHMGTRDGKVYVYDSALKKQKRREEHRKNIYTLCEDAYGVLWQGTRGDGLYVGDTRYAHREGDSSSLVADDIFSILRDSRGRMWIGTFGGGLDLAVPDSKGGYAFRHFFNHSYLQRRIRSLVEDSAGWIWVGTSDGVFVFHPDSLLTDEQAYHHYNWENCGLRSNEIRYMVLDSRGRVWIAETGVGFSVCTPGEDYARLEFDRYGVADGLVNSMVQAFVEDEQGRMWITTEYGVSCFDYGLKLFENYFFSNDMLCNVYSEGCALRLTDGRVIMGTNRGVTVVEPAHLDSAPAIPSVTFTQMDLNGVSVAADDPSSPLDRSLAYLEDIRLKHDQNSFAIHFSTLDYAAVMPPKFSCKLEGFDREWSTPTTETSVAYKNLPPGTYTLHVKACNAVGQWSQNDALLKIVIMPPFWRTGWAFMIYVSLIVVVLVMAARIFYHMNKLNNKIKVEEQLTEYKLVFFTNISHEFRTPLTLIQAALEKMHRVADIPKEMMYSMKVMDKSTQRMLRLVNQLLEFRKMQNNKLALSLEETDVIAFLYEIYLSFKDVAESKQMDFRFTPSMPSYKMFIDKGNLDKVTYNLLSNAFKYTPAGGKINFTIQVDEISKKLTIMVTDTGVGIPKEKRTQLFKRFMQSSFSGNSVGVGLHLTHELVTVHHGTIEYAENPDGGSVFTVTLPTDPSIYEEKDFLMPNNVLLQEEEKMHKNLFAMEQEEVVRAEDGISVKSEDGIGTSNVPLNKRRLLVIEDDTDVREFLKQELLVYFDVEAEADGKAGLERAASADFDLIVCDVLMPGLSGFEVTRRLKGNFNTSHIPIILLTALDSSESHLEGVESGADAYITKPFSTRLLLARIFQLIGQRDKLREKFSSDISQVRPLMYATDKDKEFADKLTRIVEEELENPDFTVDDFAARMALGRTIFYRKVKGITGYPPKEYLRIIRMKKAAELLLDANINVSEVAYKVGISDPFYFSRCFKAQFGVSPSVYQKNGGVVPKEEKTEEHTPV